MSPKIPQNGHFLMKKFHALLNVMSTGAKIEVNMGKNGTQS